MFGAGRDDQDIDRWGWDKRYMQRFGRVGFADNRRMQGKGGMHIWVFEGFPHHAMDGGRADDLYS
jgi:hypothetical protein